MLNPVLDLIRSGRVKMAKKRDKNVHRAGGFARWGNDKKIEPRGQISISMSVRNRLYDEVAETSRRDFADTALTRALDAHARSSSNKSPSRISQKDTGVDNGK